MIDYSTVPVSYMAEGLKRYFEEHIEPGGFMLCVLENNLVGAVSRADSTNRANLAAWVEWLYNKAPSHSWGSMEKVRAWLG